MKSTFYYKEVIDDSGTISTGSASMPFTDWNDLRRVIEDCISDELHVIFMNNPSVVKADIQVVIPTHITKVTLSGFGKEIGMFDISIVNDGLLILNPDSDIEIIVDRIFLKNSNTEIFTYSSGLFRVDNNLVNYDIKFINSLIISETDDDNSLITVWDNTDDFEDTLCSTQYLGCTIENIYLNLNQCGGTGSTVKVFDGIVINATSTINPVANSYWDGCSFSESDPGWPPVNLGPNNNFGSSAASEIGPYSPLGTSDAYIGIEETYYKKLEFLTSLTEHALPSLDGGIRKGPGALHFSGEKVYVDLAKETNGSGDKFDPMGGGQFIDTISASSLGIPYAATFKIKGIKEISNVQGGVIIGVSDQNYATFESWDLQSTGLWSIKLTDVFLPSGDLIISQPSQIDMVDVRDFLLIANTPDTDFNIVPCEISSTVGGMRFLDCNIHCNTFDDGGQDVRAGSIDFTQSDADLYFYGCVLSANKLKQGGVLDSDHLIKDSIVNITEYEAV